MQSGVAKHIVWVVWGLLVCLPAACLQSTADDSWQTVIAETGIVKQVSSTPEITTTWPTVTLGPRPAIGGAGPLYTVRAGDTLYDIARLHNVNVETLAAANNMNLYDAIYIGQVLIIPSSVGSTATPAPVEVTPTVESQIRVEVPTATNLPPAPGILNNLSYDDFIAMPPDVVETVQSIYATGQKLGRNPRAFTRLGDSIIESPYFLGRFDQGDYNLGNYAYLQPMINHYAGSFAHSSIAVRRGLHTWSVFDPLWAPTGTCQPNEHLLACEIRLTNPSVIFIRIGTNDKGIPERTDENFRRIIEFCIENGVIPILGTKADRFEGPGNINNDIMRAIADDYAVPLWDFDLIAGTIPGRGLEGDGVHLTTFYTHDWRTDKGFQTGQGLNNLSALIVLYEVWSVLPE